MAKKLMILPASEADHIRLIQLPNDFEPQEAYRHITGVIARLELEVPNYQWDDLAERLEDHGFIPIDFLLGPHLD